MYHKWQSYDVWFLRHGAQQTQFFLVLDHFLPFHPYNNTETENFEKLKKMTGAIIILHKCTINDNHIMPRSWHMKHDRQNFYWFWVIFCPFTPLTTQKIKILKKQKKHMEISSFYTSVPKIMIICYTVPEIWHEMYTIIFHFALLPS